MIGPFELDSEWVDNPDWSPDPEDAYDRKGYYTSVCIFEYSRNSEGLSHPRIFPGSEKSNPPFEWVKLLERCVNLLNEDEAMRRRLLNDHSAKNVAEAFKAFATKDSE